MLNQEVQIWKRLNEHTAIHYRCLMNQATRQFSVQSADFYPLQLDPEQIRQSQAQFVELLCECDPADRSDSFESIEDAIAGHVSRFETPHPPSEL